MYDSNSCHRWQEQEVSYVYVVCGYVDVFLEEARWKKGTFRLYSANSEVPLVPLQRDRVPSTV
jgi:hypothetical protein